MPFDILLVDDHRIVLDGIKAILKQHVEFRVLGEVSSGQEAIQFLKRTPVDLIVMDLKLQGLTGVETTSEVLRYFTESKVVMLSGYQDEDSVVGSLKAGARAFVLKEAGEPDLIDALRTVARGGTYLSAQVSDGLLRRLQNGNLDSRTQGPVIEGLSPRELQVMRMVAEGKTSKEIAVLLDLGLQTVRSYRKTMMKKLGVNNVAGLTQAALAAGITQLPEAQSNGRARSHVAG
jgi:DNA-binding NarL/FixJ family response regulator